MKQENEIHDFLKTASKFNKVNVAATNQKREDYYDQLFDEITDKDDRKQTIDDRANTDDIFIDDDYLFDEDDAQETKNLCDYVLDDVDQNHILFKHKPRRRHPKLPLPTRASNNIFRYSATKKQEKGRN